MLSPSRAEPVPCARARCAQLHDLLTVPLGVGVGGATALAFAPDGAVLAVGTDRGALELRAAGGGWEVLGTCGMHPAPVLALDWSDDGAALQSECAQGHHLCWDARTCAPTTSCDGEKRTST